MAVVLDFPPVCRACHAKATIVKSLGTDGLGRIIEKEICSVCGVLQAEPKYVGESV